MSLRKKIRKHWRWLMRKNGNKVLDGRTVAQYGHCKLRLYNRHRPQEIKISMYQDAYFRR